MPHRLCVVPILFASPYNLKADKSLATTYPVVSLFSFHKPANHSNSNSLSLPFPAESLVFPIKEKLILNLPSDRFIPFEIISLSETYWRGEDHRL